jgi:hypothetical protein
VTKWLILVPELAVALVVTLTVVWLLDTMFPMLPREREQPK